MKILGFLYENYLVFFFKNKLLQKDAQLLQKDEQFQEKDEKIAELEAMIAELQKKIIKNNNLHHKELDFTSGSFFIPKNQKSDILKE